jgi:hypothetical protein
MFYSFSLPLIGALKKLKTPTTGKAADTQKLKEG